MSDRASSSPLPITFGLTSHLLAGTLPFLSAGAIARLGLLPATTLLYLAGSVLIATALVVPRVRQWLVEETRALAGPRLRGPWALALTGFLVGGVAYYIGLSVTPRVAEYIFLTRLDWIAQALVAVVWLREPWNARGLAGAGLALGGGLLLAGAGAFGISGLSAALVYIGASLVGYSCVKPIVSVRGPRAALVLTMWRHWSNTAGFVLLAVAIPGAAAVRPEATGLVLALIAGAVIVVLFLLRFTALTGIPLWVLSAQAPTQALIAIVVTLATGGTLVPMTLVAIVLIVAGEVIVTRAAPRR